MLLHSRMSVFHPKFLFPIFIAIYGFLGVEIALVTGYAASFDIGIVRYAQMYSLVSYFVFIALGSYYRRLSHKPYQGMKSYEYVNLGTMGTIISTFVGVSASLLFMKVSAGSVLSFIDQLYLRQIISVGYNWILLFVFFLKIPLYDYFIRSVYRSERVAVGLCLSLIIYLVLVSLVAGRQFALITIIQLFLMYQLKNKIGLKRYLYFVVVLLFLFFGYGFYRYNQGVQAESHLLGNVAMSETDFWDVIANVMFDGWYVYLSIFTAAQDTSVTGGGVLHLSYLLKIVPRLSGYITSEMYPQYAYVSNLYNLNYRAISWISELYLDLGAYGVVLFIPFSIVVYKIYDLILSSFRSADYLRTVLLVNVYLYLLLMIRNGFGWSFTYILTEVVIFVVAIMLRSTSVRR